MRLFVFLVANAHPVGLAIFNRRSNRKIHDLEILLQSCLDAYPLWQAMESDVELLTQYAINFRYPGETADKTEAREAFSAMKRCRDEIRSVFSSGQGC